MAGESIKYECPQCSADMTDQVNKQCALTVDIPMLDAAGKAKGKDAHPESVSLQCPNGHWAEYTLPRKRVGAGWTILLREDRSRQLSSNS